MAFGYGAPVYNSYNPYYQPQQMQPQQTQSNGIQFVLGEAAAKAANVAPGTSGLFMDSEKQNFYIKTVDASGMPLPLRIFSYNEITQQAQEQPAAVPAVQNDFQQLASQVEQLTNKVDELISRMQPDKNTKGAKSDGKPAV